MSTYLHVLFIDRSIGNSSTRFESSTRWTSGRSELKSALNDLYDDDVDEDVAVDCFWYCSIMMMMMMIIVMMMMHSLSLTYGQLTHHLLYYYRPARLYGYLSEESLVSRDHHRHLWRELLQSTLSDSPERPIYTITCLQVVSIELRNHQASAINIIIIIISIDIIIMSQSCFITA